MRKDLTPLTRDKLVVVLMLEDVVNQLNLALKARKASLTLDYTGPQPKTVITMPGSMKAAVIQKTCDQGRISARISESDPGTSPAMR